jgi:hypothetical protein
MRSLKMALFQPELCFLVMLFPITTFETASGVLLKGDFCSS